MFMHHQAHPDQCEGLELYGEDHPSARHSKMNWAKVGIPKQQADAADATTTTTKMPQTFLHAKINEVVLQAGDVLYLPTYWFHMVISLGLNYQCNARSGETFENHPHMEACGFHTVREDSSR